jgi:magnesium transporter
MLSIFVSRGTLLERIALETGAPLPETAVWIDLISPTAQEDSQVESLLGIAIPTREEMLEIEVSSRLYVENDARYMTATLMCASDTPVPKTTPVHLHPLRASPGHRALRRSASLCPRQE